MEAKNVFELAVLNGTGKWRGYASLASTSSNYNVGFEMPNSQFQIDKLFEGLRITRKTKFADGKRTEYEVVGLPKEFIAVLIDKNTYQNVGMIGKLYGGFPSIFNFKPSHCRGWYTFNKGEYNWQYCEGVKIRFFFPSHLKERKLIRITFHRTEPGDNSTANWKVEITIDRFIVHSYFYKRNPEIFGN